MPRTQAPYLLKHYHELKMSGRFSSASVERIVETATAVALGKLQLDELGIVSVDDVRLYDISHQDTGNRRPINKRGDSVRIYQSSMQEITTRPLMSARFALLGISLDEVGVSQQIVKAAIQGYLNADLSEDNANSSYTPDDLNAIREALEHHYHPDIIYGTLRVGNGFTFGKANFKPFPNENYDDLITLNSFYDERYSVPQSQ